jgi:hypothetical protein
MSAEIEDVQLSDDARRRAIDGDGDGGLTPEFRDSATYRRMKADIKTLDPSTTDFEADQAIFWFLGDANVFNTEEGKSMLAAIDARGPVGGRFSASVVEEDADGGGNGAGDVGELLDGTERID